MIAEQQLGRDNAISAQLQRQRGRSSDGRARFPRPLREGIYRHLVKTIRQVDPKLEVGLCLEEAAVFETLDLAASLGRCNCML